MKQNPLKDKKLFKFIDQNQALNAIMAHITKLGISPSSSDAKKESGKKAKVSEKTSKSNQIVIKKFDETFKIIYDPTVKDVRSFILCCIVSNVQLSPPVLKEFLTHQTKLHDGMCKKRELATIATHDLDQVTSKSLRYAAKHKDDINIMPLGRHKTITANEYYSNLKAEAEVIRKEKKRSNFTGIHKFLHLLDDQESFAFLETETGTTLSLPPLTNSEVTRLSVNTKRILIEITSSANAAICLQIMTSLLSKALELNICPVDENLATLSLEQVRILNTDGNLKTLFPSKVDLQEMENETTQITRT
jgi:hypothetical protein